MVGLPYKAAILDLDGVITQTAQLHAQAWKQMFDDFLRQRADQSGNEYVPFDRAADYQQYVDGKPRYDGVRSFLKSRGIELPEGGPDDSSGAATIYGLGKRKNDLFLDLLQQSGVTVYDDTVAQIQQWRSQGMKTAVVSSSRNCQAILEQAGLQSLFDAKVDGVDSERLGLAGKPAPDIFLQAAQQLEVDPEEAIAVEDAISGVKAARAGRFGLVVGVVRDGDGSVLKEQGADCIVHDLRELSQLDSNSRSSNSSQPQSALDHFDEIQQRLSQHSLVLCTDYDGTLTPIVDRPEDATLSDDMRSLLQTLAQHLTVAVISGRDLSDVQQMVQLENLYYAGSHGFDIAGPGDLRQQQAQAQASLPTLDQAEQKLRQRLNSITGTQVERKRFAIAVHYRAAAEADLADIKAIVNDVLSQHPNLRQSQGKKILELQPDIPWDKGRAIEWLLHRLQLHSPEVVPLYLGDDTTDEDAFRALQDQGISIYVGSPDQPTQADYFLRNSDEVKQFFQALVQQVEQRSRYD